MFTGTDKLIYQLFLFLFLRRDKVATALLSYLWSWSQWWRSKRSRRISTAARLCAAWAAAPPSPARLNHPWTSCWTSWAAPLSSIPAPSSGSSPPATPARRRSRRRRSGRWRCRWWGRGSSRFASSWCCGARQGDGRRVGAGLEDGELGWLMAVRCSDGAEELSDYFMSGGAVHSAPPLPLSTPHPNPTPTSLPLQESSTSIHPTQSLPPFLTF